MSFLAPLFLLGALAVAAPIIFHLIRRTTRDRVRFSSLMFLQPTPPRLTKRSRIEHWLLLLLRAAALALLALAFARPFWKSVLPPAPATAAGGRTAVLIDVSASMRRDGLWAEAADKTRAAIRDAARAHDIALLAFDRATQTVLGFDDWRSMDPAARETEAEARLAALEPTWIGTDLASALMTAAEVLVEGDTAGIGAPRRLIVVSDLQEGSRLDSIQSYDWPKGVELTLVPVVPKTPGNAGLQLAAGAGESTAAAATGGENGVRLRVFNAADSPGESFQIGWATEAGDRFAGTAVDAYVPPGQSRVVTIPWPSETPAPGLIRLEGDSVPFDNVVAAAPPPLTRVSVRHFGKADAGDPGLPLFFLQKALPRSPRLVTGITTLDPDGPLPPDGLADASFAVITEPLADEVARAVRSRIEAGATVLLVLNGSGMAGTLSALADSGSNTLEDVTPGTYAMLGEIDFRHPLFAPFADPRFSDFTKIRFQRYRKIDPAALTDARVVARFDSGDPALVEWDVERGRLVVLTAGWVIADSQLAVSSKFPPLIASMLEWSGATRLAPAAYMVGDPLPRLALGAPEGVPITVRTPAGASTEVSAETPAFADTSEPGIYLATATTTATSTTTPGATAAAVPRAVPVNLDPAESRTRPLSEDDFERLGAPLARLAERERAGKERQAVAPAVETENRQKLWRWFLAAAMAVLLLETLLAGRAARRDLTPAETAP